MGTKKSLWFALLSYIGILGMVWGLDYRLLLRPIPIVAVLLGTLLLTLAAYKPNMPPAGWKASIKRNALFSGGIGTLLGVLARPETSLTTLLEALMPSAYGALLFTVIAIFERDESSVERLQPVETKQAPVGWYTAEVALPVLMQMALSSRECHVAIKIIQGDSNKEIAEQLFITEATVKKHIQSIYKKCEVTDRQSFVMTYLERLK